MRRSEMNAAIDKTIERQLVIALVLERARQ